MAAWPCPLMRKRIGEGQPTLYLCRQRTAFHVHTGQLLRNSFAEYRQGLSSVEKKHGLEDATDGSRSSFDLQEKQPLGCADAISVGLKEMQAGNYESAIVAFTMALSVSPDSESTHSDVTVQVSVSPSEEEEEAALYNLACCYSKLGELDSGLAVLRGLLELPCFHDFDVLRHTPDLQELRSTHAFVALLQEFDQGAMAQVGGDSGSSLEDSQHGIMGEAVVASVSC